MAFEVVTLSAGGLQLQPVTIGITMAHDEAARAFEAKVKAPNGMGQGALLRALKGSPSCTIRTRTGDEPFAPMGGDLILTGHVEKRSPRLAGEEKELPISGRSKTGDLVDSSAEHKTGEFLNKKAPDVFGELAGKHGVKVETEVSHAARKVFRLRPGETVFTAVERWSRAEGFTVSDTPEGNLKLAKEGKKRHAGVIADGDNVWPKLVDASAVFDDSKRFKNVKVRAQAPDGYAPTELRVEGDATDEGGGRNRTRVIVPPEAIAKDDARKRAQWHRDRAAGEGTTAEVKVVGWRDAGGTLWTPGYNVAVSIDDLDLEQDMTIKSVKLDQSDDGTFATLSLVDPRAFGGKKSKAGKSGGSFDLGKAGGDDA